MSFDRERRNLRKARILDALGQAPDEVVERRDRDSLLAGIGLWATNTSASIDKLEATNLDATLSAALARVAEHPMDSLAVLSAASQVLAADGHIARLKPLSQRYRDLASQIAVERPALAVVLDAFASVVSDEPRVGEQRLAAFFGSASRSAQPIPKDWSNVADVFLANALRTWINTHDQTRLRQALKFGRDAGDAVLTELSMLFIAYGNYVNIAALEVVLPEVDSRFSQAPRLHAYLQRRRISALLPAQLAAVKAGALSDRTRLIAMPTSAGKTLLAELRIAAELTRGPGRRAVYLAPYRVLARQVEGSMRRGLRMAGLSVKDLGSDFDIAIDEQLDPGELPDLAVMTPERMDAILRLSTSSRAGATEAQALLEAVSLVVIDEAHLVGRPGRGPRLELLIARLKERLPNADLFALSAAAEGAQEFSSWLGDPEPISGGRSPTSQIEMLWKTDGSLVQNFFGTPVKVTTLPRAATAMDAAAQLTLSLRHELSPILILETTRPYAENVVRKIRSRGSRDLQRWRSSLSQDQKSALDDAAEEARLALGDANDLAILLQEGLAYHHAGIPPHLLRAIEGLAEAKALRALGATTTVAEGAHLPFVVVVVPHLNFQGSPRRRLERDLYLNIRGRAGRANVAAEGMVILLDSNSPTLRGHVERQLWQPRPQQIQGQLHLIQSNPQTLPDRQALRELQSQILAWLGEGNEVIEHQAEVLASRTYSWASLPAARARITTTLAESLEILEKQGFVRSASPYALTSLGARARLAGLSPASCLRLHAAIRRFEPPRFADLLGALDEEAEITSDSAAIICALIFETEEVLQNSLWYRKLRPRPGLDKVRVLGDVTSGARPWPYEDPIFQSDIELMRGWIRERSYVDIGEEAPLFERGVFSTQHPGTRAADAAEYLGRLSYSAAWSWSAALTMLGPLGDEFPSWVRRSVEWGVKSETAVELMTNLGLSRSGAAGLGAVLGPSWAEALPVIEDFTEEDLELAGISNADQVRFMQRRERLGGPAFPPLDHLPSVPERPARPLRQGDHWPPILPPPDGDEP